MFAPTWVQKVLFTDRQKEKYTAQPFSLTSTRKRSLQRIYAAPPLPPGDNPRRLNNILGTVLQDSKTAHGGSKTLFGCSKTGLGHSETTLGASKQFLGGSTIAQICPWRLRKTFEGCGSKNLQGRSFRLGLTKGRRHAPKGYKRFRAPKGRGIYSI